MLHVLVMLVLNFLTARRTVVCKNSNFFGTGTNTGGKTACFLMSEVVLLNQIHYLVPSVKRGGEKILFSDSCTKK